MVVIQSTLTLITVMMATAVTAGIVNANLRFFRIDDPSCDGGVQTDQSTIFNPPIVSDELGVNTCIPHSAWGSVSIDQIGVGCIFEEFIDPECTVSSGRPNGTAARQCIEGLGLDAFYEIIC